MEPTWTSGVYPYLGWGAGRYRLRDTKLGGLRYKPQTGMEMDVLTWGCSEIVDDLEFYKSIPLVKRISH